MDNELEMINTQYHLLQCRSTFETILIILKHNNIKYIEIQYVLLGTNGEFRVFLGNVIYLLSV